MKSTVCGITFRPESTLHLEMKAAVASRLHADGFRVIIEPLFPPNRALWWSGYRPDLFAVSRSDGNTQCIFAECETNPSARRILRKRICSVGWQSPLEGKLQVHFLLVVPRGRLSLVSCSSIRRVWEVWTYEEWSGAICQYPAIGLE